MSCCCHDRASRVLSIGAVLQVAHVSPAAAPSEAPGTMLEGGGASSGLDLGLGEGSSGERLLDAWNQQRGTRPGHAKYGRCTCALKDLHSGMHVCCLSGYSHLPLAAKCWML